MYCILKFKHLTFDRTLLAVKKGVEWFHFDFGWKKVEDKVWHLVPERTELSFNDFFELFKDKWNLSCFSNLDSSILDNVKKTKLILNYDILNNGLHGKLAYLIEPSDELSKICNGNILAYDFLKQKQSEVSEKLKNQVYLIFNKTKKLSVKMPFGEVKFIDEFAWNEAVIGFLDKKTINRILSGKPTGRNTAAKQFGENIFAKYGAAPYLSSQF